MRLNLGFNYSVFLGILPKANRVWAASEYGMQAFRVLPSSWEHSTHGPFRLPPAANMGLDTYEALQGQYDALNELYDRHLDAVEQMQATLERDIVPGLVDEQGLDEADVDRAREWLKDTRKSCHVLSLERLK